MTECGPLVSYAQWDEFKPGSVGRIVDRMEVRIDSEDPENKVGEILVKGMNVMLGYYKNPEATKAVMMPDGWVPAIWEPSIKMDFYISAAVVKP